MYLSYYKLNKNPFQVCTDPNFLWLGDKQKKALSLFKHGVRANKGFMLLTGDVGTGKTTLINAFVNILGSEVITARVSDPGLPRLGLIKYIAEMFKMKTHFETKSEFLILFTAFLEQAHIDEKKVLLVIDEAQYLTDKTLEEIRLLSNIEKQDKKLLNIFLVGQNEFNETLEKYNNRAFRQRLAVNYSLYPFEAEETKACIEFRLAIAGSKTEIFTPEAIEAIHTVSEGFPRVINMICDEALLRGYLEKQETISGDLVWECSQELHLGHLLQPKSFVGSADDLFENSELPPLTDAAITRATKSLPEFTAVPPPIIKRKPLTYQVIIPLFIVALLLSGFFILKNSKIESISQLFANRHKETISSNLEEKLKVAFSIQSTNETEVPKSPEAKTDTEITPSPPVLFVEMEQKLTEQETKSVEVVNESGPEAQAEATSELIEKADTNEHIQSEMVLNQDTELRTNRDEEQSKIAEQESLKTIIPDARQVVDLPAFKETVTDNNVTSPEVEIAVFGKVRQEPVSSDTHDTSYHNTTEELPTDEEEEIKTELEKIAQLPQSPVTKTTVLAENDILTELEALPPPAAGSMEKEIERPSSTREITAEPTVENDPGAIVDWLLKSK